MTDCMFLRRSYAGTPITDVKSLFKVATIANIDGNASNTRKVIKIANSAMSSGDLYGFGYAYNYGATYCIQKISNKVVGNVLKYYVPSGSSYARILNNGTTQIELSQSTSTSTQFYAGTLALFSFNTTTDISDSLLSSCTLTALATPNGTSAQTLSTTSTTHKIVIVYHSAYLTVWEYDGSWKTIVSTPTIAGTASGTTLSLTLANGERGSGLILALD